MALRDAQGNAIGGVLEPHAREPDGATRVPLRGELAAHSGDDIAAMDTRLDECRVVIELDYREFSRAAAVPHAPSSPRGAESKAPRDEFRVNGGGGNTGAHGGANGGANGGGTGGGVPTRPFSWQSLSAHAQHTLVLKRWPILAEFGARCAEGRGNCTFIGIGHHMYHRGPHERLAFRATDTDHRIAAIDKCGAHRIHGTLTLRDMPLLYEWTQKRITAYLGLNADLPPNQLPARLRDRGVAFIGTPLEQRIASDRRYAVMRKFSAPLNALPHFADHEKPRLEVIVPQRVQWRGCFNCGAKAHTQRDCPSGPKCANCGGDHRIGEMRECPDGIMHPCTICHSRAHRANRCPQRQSFRLYGTSVMGGRFQFAPVSSAKDGTGGIARGGAIPSRDRRGGRHDGGPKTDHRPMLAPRPRMPLMNGAQFPALTTNAAGGGGGGGARVAHSVGATADPVRAWTRPPQRGAGAHAPPRPPLPSADIVALIEAQNRRTDQLFAQMREQREAQDARMDAILAAIISIIPITESNVVGRANLILELTSKTRSAASRAAAAATRSDDNDSAAPLMDSGEDRHSGKRRNRGVTAGAAGTPAASGDDSDSDARRRTSPAGAAATAATAATAAAAQREFKRTGTPLAANVPSLSSVPRAGDTWRMHTSDKAVATGRDFIHGRRHSFAAGAATLHGGNLSSSNTSTAAPPAPVSAFPPAHATPAPPAPPAPHAPPMLPPVPLTSAAAPPLPSSSSSPPISRAPAAAAAAAAVSALAPVPPSVTPAQTLPTPSSGARPSAARAALPIPSALAQPSAVDEGEEGDSPEDNSDDGDAMNDVRSPSPIDHAAVPAGFTLALNKKQRKRAARERTITTTANPRAGSQAHARKS